MSDIELTIRRTPSVKVYDTEGTLLFETTVLSVNSMIITSEFGLQANDPNFMEVSRSRLAAMLNEKHGTDLSAEDAYQIARGALNALQELRQGFPKGPKSQNSTDSTPAG